MDHVRGLRRPARCLRGPGPRPAQRHLLDVAGRLGGGRPRGGDLLAVHREGSDQATGPPRCRDARDSPVVLEHRRHLLDDRVSRRRDPTFARPPGSLLPALLSLRLHRCRTAHAQRDKEDLQAKLVGRHRCGARGRDALRGICISQHRALCRWQCTRGRHEPCIPDRGRPPARSRRCSDSAAVRVWKGSVGSAGDRNRPQRCR